jgi:hypothetical protein
MQRKERKRKILTQRLDAETLRRGGIRRKEKKREIFPVLCSSLLNSPRLRVSASNLGSSLLNSSASQNRQKPFSAPPGVK